MNTRSHFPRLDQANVIPFLFADDSACCRCRSSVLAHSSCSAIPVSLVDSAVGVQDCLQAVTPSIGILLY